jgi:hypothetical protein
MDNANRSRVCLVKFAPGAYVPLKVYQNSFAQLYFRQSVASIHTFAYTMYDALWKAL